MACPVRRVACSPLRTELTGDQRTELESRARSYTLPYWQVVRAKLVLIAADGVANNEVAVRLGTSPQVVHRWRIALSRWSSAELARELVTREVVPGISAGTVWRTLPKDAIRPWYYRSWIAPREPDFAAKAARVLDLYASCFEDQALGDNEFVICADEKTSIQARCRCHPTLPPGKARVMRVGHEYERGGALAYLAAYDVHRARVFGRCEDTTGFVPFGRLVEQVMSSEPYASAERVFWVVDNGSFHRGKASVHRLQGEWPTLRLVHLPVHASWLDQGVMWILRGAAKSRCPRAGSASGPRGCCLTGVKGS